MMKRLKQLLSRKRLYTDLDEEIAFHLGQRVQELVATGMSAKDAGAVARREFGNVAVVKETAREAWGWRWLEDLFGDLRFGVRTLRKNPGFTAVAVLTLALGIGANTAVFTIFDAVLLESLPVREPSRLVLFTDDMGEGSFVGDPPSSRWEAFSSEVSDYLRKQPLPFESLTAFRSGEDTVTFRLADSPSANDPPEQVRVHLVSGNYFRTMGVDSIMGRTLGPDDERLNAPAVAVASYGYWKQRLDGDPAVIGKTAYLNGSAVTIVGVAPSEFFGERMRQSPDFW